MTFFVTFSSVNIASNEGFLKNGKDPYLTVMSAGHVLHVFVNGKLSGSGNNTILGLWQMLFPNRLLLSVPICLT